MYDVRKFISFSLSLNATEIGGTAREHGNFNVPRTGCCRSSEIEHELNVARGNSR
jgi:hypothetical protein